MTTTHVNRTNGAALILAGTVWSAGSFITNQLSDSDPLQLVIGTATFVGAPVIVLFGFGSTLLVAHRSGRLDHLVYAACIPAILGSLALTGATLNLLVHTDSDPAWYVFMWGAIAFVAGLGMSMAITTIFGMLPRWSAVPTVVIAASAVVAWLVGQPMLNLVALPQAFMTVVVLGLGGALVLAGVVLYVTRRGTILSPRLGQKAAL